MTSTKQHYNTDALLRQYELCVEMADRISQRRDSANRFFSAFLTTSATVVSAAVLVGKQVVGRGEIGMAIFAASVLILPFSGIWIVTLHRYKKLNEAKFHVILEMEKHLTWQCFGEEKKRIDQNKTGPLTNIELLVPWLILVLSVVGVGVGIIWWLAP